MQRGHKFFRPQITGISYDFDENSDTVIETVHKAVFDSFRNGKPRKGVPPKVEWTEVGGKQKTFYRKGKRGYEE